MDNRPTIRVLRHLARSGGTLISRCLGCMNGVTLLSEVHPRNTVDINPYRQACRWFGLVSYPRYLWWKHIHKPDFEDFIRICHTRTASRGSTLVLRDWSHIDYIGLPWTEPVFGSALCDALESRFRVVRSATVRHPIDQWISLKKLPILNDLTLKQYLRGCVEFARDARSTGFVRYEDFTQDPTTAMQTICDRLELSYDRHFLTNWSRYTTITGDTVREQGRGVGDTAIRVLKPRAIEPELREAFLANPDHRETCELLGYPLVLDDPAPQSAHQQQTGA